jgi:endonuclease VIII
MPEGPSILIIRDILAPQITGKPILGVSGNAKIDMTQVLRKKVNNVLSWGKHLLIILPDCTIRIHLLMFETYSIDEQTRPDKSLRLMLTFSRKSVYFYTCSVKILPGDINLLYDWEGDVLSDKWNAAKARKKLKQIPDAMVCDALLDQQIFAGVGNIIKNEVLYRVKLHPETLVGSIPPRKLTSLIKEARNYSFDFLKWKKEFTLKKHWLVNTKKICGRCNLPLLKKYCSKTKRRTFFCSNCQVKYT